MSKSIAVAIAALCALALPSASLADSILWENGVVWENVRVRSVTRASSTTFSVHVVAGPKSKGRKVRSGMFSGWTAIEIGDGPLAVPAPASELSFSQIREKMKSLTKAQQNAYVRSLMGKRVAWQGWVVEVHKMTFGSPLFEKGQPQLRVDMDPPSASPSIGDPTDVHFFVSAAMAPTFKKGQAVRFSGVINWVLAMPGVYTVFLDDVEVER